MPTYPTTLRIAARSTGGSASSSGSHSSTEEWTDAVLISRSRSGSVKARRVATTKKRTFKIAHEFLTATDKATLESFYDANRSATFTFTILGASYTCIFGDSAIQWEALSFNLWTATVLLLEV